ncbi:MULTISPECIES: MarR family winged helix-turn-helix transcriptional regulator [Microbacterium]|uniref:MarR family winged helix-turn-helix transcriptional regulator n=1 Tax=Microbacterium TaxID=33882 RepID=UPI001F226D44|nr:MULTISPECIES: helix-turn-helix domain-containing protein [Microbacterium]UIN31938.1 MarR family winged helix-turn-helix transcriptional regulator [Microbacterium binotii]WDG16831.1 helix-turn-helix domain-containing protein [Microbacterium sp. Clip185]
MSSEAASTSKLSRALNAYSAARNDALVAARKDLRISEVDARALLFVVDNPGVRPSALRDYLGITSAGVTSLVDRLVERGLARRESDAEDRRGNHITATVDLTTEPWSALTEFDRRFERAVEMSLGPRSDELAALLTRLTEESVAQSV